MASFFHRAALVRMCLGIFIVLDGYPLGFFFKETIKIPLPSEVFTAGFMLLGLALMIPSTAIRKMYAPNVAAFNCLIGFVVLCIFYAFMFNQVAVGDRGKDMIYYTFVILFILLLINVPNEITEEIIWVGVMFTLVSNLALVYALLTDPSWSVGQRAAIQFGEEGEKMGNPHVFSRNAQIGLVCCLMWCNRLNQPFLIRIFALSLAIFNIIIIMLTFSKSAILSTLLTAVIYMVANIRHTSPRKLLKTLTSPISLIIISLPFLGFIGLVIARPEIWDILTLYGELIFGRFSENILALLGGENAKGELAELDGSSVNRAISWTYVTYAVVDDPVGMIMGYGYKYFFMDIPILEALIDQGIVGFLLYAYIFYSMGKAAFKAIYDGNRTDVELLSAYMFFLFLVSYCTSGRPYEMLTLHPLCLFVRFLGVVYPPNLLRGYTTAPPPVTDAPVLDAPPTMQLA